MTAPKGKAKAENKSCVGGDTRFLIVNLFSCAEFFYTKETKATKFFGRLREFLSERMDALRTRGN
jgi:hypothetical protein